jgi:SAM-dependent methyltransferase
MPQITELWADVEAKQAWYAGGAAHWASTEPTNDGVLGGYGHVHAADVKDSRAFAAPLLAVKPKRALDVAAGIGRVSGGLLLDMCDRVDLLEECERFVKQARSQLASAGNRVRFFCSSMQDFVPEPGSYDLIWIQWCIGSLSDADLVAFLTRCKAGLATGALAPGPRRCGSGRSGKERLAAQKRRTGAVRLEVRLKIARADRLVEACASSKGADILRAWAKNSAAHC